jgi:hypothetical protein
MQSAGSQADSARKSLTYRHADRSAKRETDGIREAAGTARVGFSAAKAL